MPKLRNRGAAGRPDVRRPTRTRSAPCSGTEVPPRARAGMVRVLLAVLLGALGFFPLMPAGARADMVRVLAAGAAQGALLKLEPAFKSATGHTIDGAFDTVGALRDRVLAG